MIGNEMFLLKRGCGALGLDEIAKDIQEKKRQRDGNGIYKMYRRIA